MNIVSLYSKFYQVTLFYKLFGCSKANLVALFTRCLSVNYTPSLSVTILENYFKNESPHWKVKPPYQEINPWKKLKNIGNFHQYLWFTHKITLEKDGRNSTKTWFFSFAAFKITQEKWNSLLGNIILLDQLTLANKLSDVENFMI